MTRKFGRSCVLEIPTWCGRNRQHAASPHKLRKFPPGSSPRPGYLCRFFPHHEALFSTLLSELPVVSTFAGTEPTVPRIALETVTMGRSDLSMVVTDQKPDEPFFHEGSHV
jgi:hypothetical protein